MLYASHNLVLVAFQGYRPAQLLDRGVVEVLLCAAVSEGSDAAHLVSDVDEDGLVYLILLLVEHLGWGAFHDEALVGVHHEVEVSVQDGEK